MPSQPKSQSYNIRLHKLGKEDITVYFHGTREALDLKIKDLREEYPGWGIETRPDTRPTHSADEQ